MTGYAHALSSPGWDQLPYTLNLEATSASGYSDPHEWRIRAGQFDADDGLEYFVRWRTLNTVRFRIFDSPVVSGLSAHPQDESWQSASPDGVERECGYLPLDVVPLGDLDGDGNPEMLSINTGNDTPAPGCPDGASAQVNVIEWEPETSKVGNAQAAHFRFVEGLDVAAGNNQLRYVAVGDPDGDGKPEIVVVAAQNGGNPGGLYVFEVNPAGFDTPGVGVLVPDGGPASAEPFATQVGISTNGGVGGGSATVSGGQGGLHVADLDGDGIDEIIVAYAGSQVSSGVRIYSLDGTNGAGDPNYVGTQAAQFLATASVAVGDYDLDGRMEIYTTNLQSDGIRSMEHDGAAGDFSPSAFRVTTHAIELGAGLGLTFAAPNADGSTLDAFVPTAAQSEHPDADDPRPELMAFGRGAVHLLEALPAFGDLMLELPTLGRPVGAIGDADGDGVLDVVLMGESNGTAATGFLLSGAIDGQGALAYTQTQPFSPRVLGDAVWFDVDNDGHLDLAYTGGSSTGGGGAVNLIVMQNDGAGGFSELIRINRGVRLGDIEVLDYDFDGDQDLLMMGDPFEGGTPALTTLFRNTLDEGRVGFGRDLDHGLPTLSYARAASVRLDNGTDDSADDRLLIALQGRDSDGDAYAGVWSRAPGDAAFANENAPVIALQDGDVAWIDVIGDAQPDLILSGSILLADGGDPIRETLVYENTPGPNGPGFSPSSSTQVRGLPATDTRYLAPADFDRDGLTDLVLRTPSLADDTQDRFDVFLQRRSGSGDLSATTFEPMGLRLGLSGREGVTRTPPLVLVADLDGDTFEDVLISGRSFRPANQDVNLVNQTTVFRNAMRFGDTGAIGGSAAGSGKRMDGLLPTPTGLDADASSDGRVTLDWNAALAQGKLSQADLTYDVSVGTSAGATDIVAPLADVGGGFRKALSTQRNFGTTYQLRDLPPGTYYWGVQTVYGSLSSPFASGSFVVPEPAVTAALSLDAVTNGQPNFVVQPGDLITFEVNVGNEGRPQFGPVENLAGVGLQIQFVDAAVEFVGAQVENGFLGSTNEVVTSVSQEEVDGVQVVALALSRTVDTGVSGSGILAAVTFRVRPDFESMGDELVGLLPFRIANVLASGSGRRPNRTDSGRWASRLRATLGVARRYRCQRDRRAERAGPAAHRHALRQDRTGAHGSQPVRLDRTARRAVALRRHARRCPRRRIGRWGRRPERRTRHRSQLDADAQPTAGQDAAGRRCDVPRLARSGSRRGRRTRRVQRRPSRSSTWRVVRLRATHRTARRRRDAVGRTRINRTAGFPQAERRRARYCVRADRRRRVAPGRTLHRHAGSRIRTVVGDGHAALGPAYVRHRPHPALWH